MKPYTRWRILTRKQWKEHRDRHFPVSSGWSQEDRDKAADLAAANSNYMHNPATGHHEFAVDTPAWIVGVAQRRNWISNKGRMEWK